jgi:PAS domain S-box-containing protein
MASRQIKEIINNLSLTYHLENSSIGIILWNRNLEMIYCSPKGQEIFQWETDLYLNKPFPLEDFVYAEDLNKVNELVAEITSGRVLHSQGINRNLTASGNVIYCQWYNSALKDDAGNVVNILSLVQDVTEQMQTSLSLQASEHQLSLMFEGAIDPMWLVRVEGNSKFRFERINAAFSKVTGWSREQVLGQPIESIMPVASHELVRGKYNETIRLGRIIDYVEEAAHPNGIKYGEIRVIPIRDESGCITRLLGIANDITEKVLLQKKLDAERDNLNRQITAAAIKGQELERAKVSRELHDNVNQVLTTVKLYLELCIDEKVDKVEVLSKSALLLNETINEIRSLSKQLSAPSLGDMNFRETLQDLVTSVGNAAQMNISLQVGLNNCLEMDSELHLTIYRIVQEQLTNILKYAKADRVTIELKQTGRTMQLIIEDNGIGFDTKQKTNGLGLTNMRSRTAILGGSFEIESNLKKGTKVVVRFPVMITGDKYITAEIPKNLQPAFFSV